MIKILKDQLSKSLPGNFVQYQMAPENRDLRTSKNNNLPKKGSVLILLFPKEKKLYFLLTERADNLKFHSGQISFPGGTFEITDNTLLQTALRETYEETGLPVSERLVLGQLTPLYIPVSNFEVLPFVAFFPDKPKWKKNNREVKSLIEVNLTNFLNQEPLVKEEKTKDGRMIKIPFFQIENHKVWGATAMILNEFRAILKATNLF